MSDIKGGCKIDDGGHWIWAGAQSHDGKSRIYAPDFTRDPTGNTLRVQAGKRAVWHIKTGQPIPPLHRIYSRCLVPGCHKPGCLVCETEQQYGARMRKTGHLRGSLLRSLISRRNGAAQRVISDEQLAEIMEGKLTDGAMAEKCNVNRCTIAKYRRGLSKSVPNHFQGLMR